MGVSLHNYPRAWLLEQAKRGDLFAYHVGHEGIALRDGDGFLLDLRKAFSRRASYTADVRVGLFVARLLAETDWGADASLRRRFFWGVRTCLISWTAEEGSPIFSARMLESSTAIDGLADLIGRRATASFEECRTLSERLERALPDLALPRLTGDALRGFLTKVGGYAAECAYASDKRVWEDQAEVAVYA
ncbi:hypothetical protein [Sphingomonas sp. S2-65]|uniref:hypothetical protein n=1 Tax=Sphingomonas sp. S2-65 TaxID=2903960 RepID=UPI001F1866A3|nr:hypothetical protein [Sphingomonas sp. S2-65]UYY60014.1 hypothetical protein LZ586_07990 [Sphingomonas sp. S2-65]